VKRDLHVVPGDPLSRHMAPVCDSQHMFMQPSSAEPTSAAADSPVQNEFAAEILSSVAIHWSAPSIQGLATIVSCPSCGICNTLFGVVICGDGGDDDDDDTVNVFVFLFLFLCFQSISSFDH